MSEWHRSNEATRSGRTELDAHQHLWDVVAHEAVKVSCKAASHCGDRKDVLERASKHASMHSATIRYNDDEEIAT